MILCDKTLKKLCREQKLITPYKEQNVQPGSIDLTLDNEYQYLDNSQKVIDLAKKINYKWTSTPTYKLNPQQFVLATTEEYINIPANCSAFVEGRSSIGRLGLFIQNAGWIDAGFKGQITLELYNASPVSILLESGIRICQLVVAKMDNECEQPYRGKYQGQFGTTGSKINLDREMI
ncbi:dCTP deaminase [Halocella sp. SP3-1]|uniref:dCTP deaminase n=1 Tax=Halocella sp. SP3-1 TaxID=2382161 RepID=UPI000F762EB8|nr:dCTP deaminase [Halocella sp. SP3-1]AZO96153.1 dCTP deaminase [Halocella sp. SP3-1]